MSLANAARCMNLALDDLRGEPQGDLQPGREMPADTAGAARVFISYAHADLRIVRRFAAVVAAAGYDVWWDARIEAGDAFEAKIVEAMAAAVAVVVLWSDRSITSSWVKWEANQALKQKKLIPLAAPGLDLRDIRPPFSDLNTLALADTVKILETLQALDARSGAMPCRDCSART